MLMPYANGTARYNSVWQHASHLQTQAAISLALFGALRNSEIRYASIDDIHPDNEYIVVRGKSPFGERQGYREVPYTEEGRESAGREKIRGFRQSSATTRSARHQLAHNHCYARRS